MSALMISRFSVKDQTKFEQYMAKTRPLAVAYGAEGVFAGVNSRVLNGKDANEQVVVVRFPDINRVNQWFDSEDYRALEPLREAAADMTMVAYA